MALADEESPACVLGGFQGMTAAMRAEPKVTEAFRTGDGVGWHEHDPGLFDGTERFFRPGYNANLVSTLDSGARRRAGQARARGAAWPTSAAATAPRRSSWPRRFPRSTFVGFDYHAPSIERARERAAAPASRDRVTLRGRHGEGLPGHVRSGRLLRLPARHGRSGRRRRARAPVAERRTAPGCWSSRFAGDQVEDNLNPVGRLFYSVSTLVCTQASLAQEVGTALGAQAGEARLRDVVTSAGFTRFRRAAETPFNLVFEVRP